MKTSGSITNNNVHISVYTCIYGVKYNGCRVCSLLVLNNLNISPLCPYLKLVNSCRTEGIGCAEYNLFTLAPEIIRHLSYGGRFSDAVYAYNENYCRSCHEVYLLILSEHFRNNVLDTGSYFGGMLYSVFSDSFLYLVNDKSRGLNANVSHDENLCKPIIEFIAYFIKSIENVVDISRELVPGFLHSLAYLSVKKSHWYLSSR